MTTSDDFQTAAEEVNIQQINDATIGALLQAPAEGQDDPLRVLRKVYAAFVQNGCAKGATLVEAMVAELSRMRFQQAKDPSGTYSVPEDFHADRHSPYADFSVSLVREYNGIDPQNVISRSITAKQIEGTVYALADLVNEQITSLGYGKKTSFAERYAKGRRDISLA